MRTDVEAPFATPRTTRSWVITSPRAALANARRLSILRTAFALRAAITFVALLGTLAVVGCGGRTTCTPGESRVCTCAGGGRGSQRCFSTGEDYAECMCDSSDAGTPIRDTGTPDAPRLPACSPCTGTSECAAGLSCNARMCDGLRACYATGGVCNTIAGRSCPVTAVCGDGSCNGSETCGTCASDCGRCECDRCSSTMPCATGFTCGERRCDGARACYASGPGASCATIAGTSMCPPHPLYDTCAVDTDCRSPTFTGAACRRLPGTAAGSNLHCVQLCGTSADCTLSPGPDFDTESPMCSGGLCLFPCRASAPICPTGTICGDGIRYGLAGLCS